MRVKGALHVHSNLSHDGRMSVAEVAAFYRCRGYHFVAMGDHSQDMDAAKVRAQVADCAAHSDERFLMIAGIEYTCRQEGMHILGVGCLEVTSEHEPLPVAQLIRRSGGFAVLAHPKRFGWQASPELLQALDAAEFWNVGYDGRFLPSMLAPAAYERMLQANPKLLAVPAHDLHSPRGYYDVAVEMELPALTRQAVLQSLFAGAYRIRSRFFNSGPQPRYSAMTELYLRVGGAQLNGLRKVKRLAAGLGR